MTHQVADLGMLAAVIGTVEQLAEDVLFGDEADQAVQVIHDRHAGQTVVGQALGEFENAGARLHAITVAGHDVAKGRGHLELGGFHGQISCVTALRLSGEGAVR